MLSRLEPANESLSRPEQLRKRFREDGYLFFRKVVDEEAVAKIRRDIMRLLREYKMIEEEDARTPIWSGRMHPDDNERLELHTKIHGLESFRRFRYSKGITDILKILFGEKAYCWFNADVRTHVPKDTPPTPIHQDYYYLRGSEFVVCWIPLTDVDESVGGVAIAPGSHRGFSAENYEISSTPFGGVALPTLPEKRVGGEFARADYHPGDVLIFDCKTAHRSLPNRSKILRISVDYRYQPRSSKKPWYVHKTSSWLEGWSFKAASTLTRLNANQEVIQKVYWPMFWEGGRITQARVSGEISRAKPER